MDEDDIQGRAKGGFARAQALSKDRRKEIGRRAAAVRWDKVKEIPRADYFGQLTIGDMVFPCSVLSDGTRILTQSDFMSGMGMYYSGWVAKNRPIRAADDLAAEVPLFLAFKTLKPYVDKHLGDLQSITVTYRTEGGNIARGIKAEIIPKICDVWLDADDQEKLGKRQKQVANKAKLLMRALAHTGIIALVDEATGYQEVRDKRALQAILDEFLRTSLALWAKRFPDEFYWHIFRLKGWEWKGRKVNPPQVVAYYTNDLVYHRLAPNLVEELDKRNPVVEGRRRSKNTQWLTDEVGQPALAAHLHTVIGFMRASKTWEQLKELLDASYPRLDETMRLPFFQTNLPKLPKATAEAPIDDLPLFRGHQKNEAAN
jgi:hypothetical protein